MFRQKLTEKANGVDYLNTPLRGASPSNKKQIVISERKLAVLGLILSLSVLCGKILYNYREEINSVVGEKRMISYETLVTDGDVLVKHAWVTVLKYSRFWFPALCGLFVTFLTWLMVYLDSSVPGVQPPTPFSPSKYKKMSGHTFHLNYVFAIVVGVFVFVYMYWNNYTLYIN